MKTIKIRNILLSLILAALGLSAVFIWSAKADSGPGEISFLYVAIKITSMLAILGAVVFFILRVSRMLDPERNIGYSLIAVLNTLLGFVGVIFYLLHKINVIGLHDLLANLLPGVILLADIFIFSAIIKRR